MRVQLSSSVLELEPGSTGTVTLTVFNDSSVIAGYNVSVLQFFHQCERGPERLFCPPDFHDHLHPTLASLAPTKKFESQHGPKPS